VIEVRLETRYVDTGEPAGAQDAAAVFVVRDGCVARFAPHAGLAKALLDAGLSEDDEIRWD
jgi:hypothetical protein